MKLTGDFSYVHLFGTKMRHLPTSHFKWALTHSRIETQGIGYELGATNSLKLGIFGRKFVLKKVYAIL